MQLHLTLLLPLIGSVFAIPTPGLFSSLRPNHGYIGSWNNGCSGDAIGPRPEIHWGHCQPFKKDPSAQAVGVYFGHGADHHENLEFYSDGNCNTAMNLPGMGSVVPAPANDDMVLCNPAGTAGVGSVKWVKK